MNTYKKPNIKLPFSLHDAQITAIIVQPSQPEEAEGLIVFKFANGYYKVNNNDAYQTQKATITLSGIDYDFSRVYYFKNNLRELVDFSQLAKDVETYAVYIVDETYGYNQTKFNCNMFCENEWYEVEIEIYHFNDTIYHWEG